MKWWFSEEGYSREQVIEAVFRSGFIDAEKGWARPSDSNKKRRRIHVVPAWGHMEIHEDTSRHKVVSNNSEKIKAIIEEIKNNLTDI